ncbi:sugar ABC transporter substrate-binding protein [Streptomyces europaeiscabiei]|uniref:sugar ABC transporter substrate-binding protein n=1 Tax=Streptomyces TaxID=1883 RepID=UPI000A3C6501|nr:MULTISPECIES: sugar ABC transporter substrate-binding protein [Streptomyces]MDX3629132.1 sugar ABC transporter substrate-binding protein [Streptomyces europaeiscabiei]MDX3647250.1 sugar ABC transporter substrate-binding protein [Streptomyces europaeiscabiei]WUD36059.1 sugar ABC transporter substrate-binding protein [Streptomyces europaeiscabiei]
MDHTQSRRLLGRRPARRALTAVSLLAVMAVAATGCASGKASGGDGDRSSAPAEGGSTSAAKNGKNAIYVIGGKPDDPFWSAVKRGGEDAAKLVKSGGGSVTFLGPKTYDNLGPDAAKLTLTALSQNPSAIVVPDWVPENQDDAIKQAVKQGVPVFIYNAGGVDAAEKTGSLKYIGSDDYEAGKAGGVKFAEEGAKNILCVNTVPGAANSEARCDGIADGAKSKGAKSKQLPLPSSNFGNPSAVTQAIKGALLKDDTIDALVTIGVQDADSAAAAIDQASAADKVKLGTFDLSDSQLNRIKAGKQLFAIDQQPYLQGFYAVSIANQYLSYGVIPPQNPLLTGPLLVTKDNVAEAIAGTKAGVR